VNDIEQIISRLERQRESIERAISALREIEGPTRGSVSARTAAQTGQRKNGANRPSLTGASKESPAKVQQPKKGGLTPEGRRKLSLAAKKRWALAKRKGMNAVTGKPLGKAS
jgi:hypothetical protein